MRPAARARIVLALPLLLTLGACRLADVAGAGGAADPHDKFDGCYDRSCVAAPVVVPVVPPLASLTTLSSHTCGLTPAGEAWCWGDNSLGQLGDGTDQPRGGPVKVAGALRFRAISAGGTFTCGVALDGTAYCWGDGATAQLAQLGPELCNQGRVRCARTPLAIPGHTFTAIAAGMRHACGIESTGEAYCWGFSFLGETGSTAYGETIAVPTKVPRGNILVSLGAGDSFTCGLTSAGRAYCWGAGDRGQLGRAVPICTTVAGFTNSCSATPVSVTTSATFTTLSVGDSHSCGLEPSGVAQCWGDNGQGQLGAGGYMNSASALVAHGGKSWSTIEASGGVTCGTPATGPSECWGVNLMGKLGIGTRLELSPTPVAIVGDRRFTSFAGGRQHVCALTAAGAAYCWGSGRYGQLGTGEMLP
jgi:alpha-tubulin suppressor-like RCC1 family protein